jgi:cephalosporin-C deacetylase-like acetyl esterase
MMLRQRNPLHHSIRYSGVLLAALVAAVAAVALATSPPAGTSGPGGPTSLFDYNRSAPLELAWGKTAVSHKVAHQDLTFSVAKHARIAAYFVHPLAGAPWPLVIWTPGRGEDRSAELGDADALARDGVASLLVDPPAPEVVTCDAGKDLPIFTRYVVGRRRAVDLALTLPSVDGERIAAAGFSYGASVTAVLAGVEHRIRAFALKSGRAHHTGFMRLACPQLSQKELAAYIEKLAAIDPINWVPKATGPAFLIQDGTRDPLNPRADVLALYRAAHGPKELRFYRADHPLNAAAAEYRARWLLRHLR